MKTFGIQDARRQPAILRKSRRFGQSLTRFSMLRRIAAGDRHSLEGHASTALRPSCAEAVQARLPEPQVPFSVLSSKKPNRESFLHVSLFQKHGILD